MVDIGTVDQIGSTWDLLIRCCPDCRAETDESSLPRCPWSMVKETLRGSMYESRPPSWGRQILPMPPAGMARPSSRNWAGPVEPKQAVRLFSRRRARSRPKPASVLNLWRSSAREVPAGEAHPNQLFEAAGASPVSAQGPQPDSNLNMLPWPLGEDIHAAPGFRWKWGRAMSCLPQSLSFLCLRSEARWITKKKKKKLSCL